MGHINKEIYMRMQAITKFCDIGFNFEELKTIFNGIRKRFKFQMLTDI